MEPRRGSHHIFLHLSAAALVLALVAPSAHAQMFPRQWRGGVFTLFAKDSTFRVSLDTAKAPLKSYIKRLARDTVSASDSTRDYVAQAWTTGWSIYPHQGNDTSNGKNILCFSGTIRQAPLAQMPGTAAARYGGFYVSVSIQFGDSVYKYASAITTTGYSGGGALAAGDALFLRFLPADSRSVDKTLRVCRLPGNGVFTWVSAGRNGDIVIGDVSIPALSFPSNLTIPVYMTVTLTYYGRHAI